MPVRLTLTYYKSDKVDFTLPTGCSYSNVQKVKNHYKSIFFAFKIFSNNKLFRWSSSHNQTILIYITFVQYIFTTLVIRFVMFLKYTQHKYLSKIIPNQSNRSCPPAKFKREKKNIQTNHASASPTYDILFETNRFLVGEH